MLCIAHALQTVISYCLPQARGGKPFPDLPQEKYMLHLMQHVIELSDDSL